MINTFVATEDSTIQIYSKTVSINNKYCKFVNLTVAVYSIGILASVQAFSFFLNMGRLVVLLRLSGMLL